MKETREPEYPNRRSRRILRVAATVGASAALLLTGCSARMAGDQQPVNPHDEQSGMTDDGHHGDTGDPGDEARLPGEAPATHIDEEGQEQEEPDVEEGGSEEPAGEETRLPGRKQAASTPDA